MSNNTNNNPKVINIFCDGTWQTEKQDVPTNISKMYQAATDKAPDGSPQINFYIDGIGTNGNVIKRILDGAFAYDIEELVKKAYKNLVETYNPGDRINLFGFSRGATVARMVAALVDHAGIINRDKISETNLDKFIDKAWDLYRQTGEHKDIRGKPKTEAIQEISRRAAAFRRLASHNDEHGSYESTPHIDEMLLFDTVGTLGVQDKFYSSNLVSWIWPRLGNDYFRFYDNEVPGILDEVTHLIAMDETRDLFKLSDIVNDRATDTKIKKIYLRGDHGAVGGGTAEHEALSDYHGLLAVKEVKDAIGFDENKVTELFGKANPHATPWLTKDFAKAHNNGFLSLFVDKHIRRPPPCLSCGDGRATNTEIVVDYDSVVTLYKEVGVVSDALKGQIDALDKYKNHYIPGERDLIPA